MTDHPLTDDVLKQIVCENPLSLPCLSISGRVRVFGTQAMRAAYDLGRDEQLEQVNDFFVNYRKAVMAANPGYIPSLTELLSLMNQAMRPTTTTQEEN